MNYSWMTNGTAYLVLKYWKAIFFCDSKRNEWILGQAWVLEWNTYGIPSTDDHTK